MATPRWAMDAEQQLIESKADAPLPAGREDWRLGTVPWRDYRTRHDDGRRTVACAVPFMVGVPRAWSHDPRSQYEKGGPVSLEKARDSRGPDFGPRDRSAPQTVRR